MNTFEKCPHCGNRKDGDSIWECEDCRCVHCKECDSDNGHCPQCDGHTKKIGYIDADCYLDDGFARCPNCGNNKKNDSIWKCEDCGCIHCMDCDDPNNGHCPRCNGGTKKIGYIE